jgi:putative DNA-invertase from lambdoid prophage Rac
LIQKTRNDKSRPRAPARPPETHGYCRVSSPGQEKDGQSLDVQHDAIAAYAQAKGLGEVAFYIDGGVSGSIPIADRPAGGKLVERVRRGDHVVMTRINRGFRNLFDFLHRFESWIEHDVHLHIIDFGGNSIDPRTTMGKMIFRVLAVIAEMERDMIGENIRGSVRHMRARGLYHNKCVPHGFRAVKAADGKGYLAVPDPEARALMGRIYRWHVVDGQPLDEIRKHLVRHKVAPPKSIKIKSWTDWTYQNCKLLLDSERKLRATEENTNEEHER